MSKKKFRMWWLLLLLLAAAVVLVVMAVRLRRHESFLFQESTKSLNNPGRGFYIQLDSEDYGRMPDLAQQVRLVLLAFDMKEVGDQPISRQKLEELEQALQAAEQQHILIIFRAAYGFDHNTEEPEQLEKIGGHISQIAQVINRYRPQIAVVQAGMLGEYGEWHGGRFLDSEEWEEADRRESRLYVLRQWEKYLDPSIKVAVRRPRFIREAQEEGVLSGRLSLHNDALLSTESDMGTYDDPQMDFEAELDWMEQYLKEQYNGGEMPALGERSQPANAHAEMKKLHISYLNLKYNQEVLDYWQQAEISGAEPGESAFSFIERHLGYRMFVENISLSTSLWDRLRGKEGRIEITLQNSGYAALPEGYNVYFMLQFSDEKKEVYQVTGDQLHAICNGEKMNVAIDLPKIENESKVDLRLQISPEIQSEEEVCVRLANDTLPYENGFHRLAVLQKEKHRLDMLLTDACAAEQSAEE